MKNIIFEFLPAECGIKRKFGDEIKSRGFRSQVKELKLKLIVYSIDLFLKGQRIFITN